MFNNAGMLNKLKKMQKDMMKAQQELEEAKQLQEKLANIQVEISAKSGEGGRLFGSVTSKQIAEQLQKQHGIKLDKRKIELEDAIRALGFTKVPVKLHPEVQGTLTVHVKDEN